MSGPGVTDSDELPLVSLRQSPTGNCQCPSAMMVHVVAIVAVPVVVPVVRLEVRPGTSERLGDSQWESLTPAVRLGVVPLALPVPVASHCHRDAVTVTVTTVVAEVEVSRGTPRASGATINVTTVHCQWHRVVSRRQRSRRGGPRAGAGVRVLGLRPGRALALALAGSTRCATVPRVCDTQPNQG